MSDKFMAYVVTVKDLQPIPEKDRIVLMTMVENNWQVITQKDQLKIGDKAIYIETESILPLWPEFAFLEKRCYSVKRKGYVIKRISMGGVDSEGIVFTLDSLKDRLPKELVPGVNLTETLQIRRKEDEVPDVKVVIRKSWLQNKIDFIMWKLFRIKPIARGASEFPSYCIKTDETQIQSIPDVFNIMNGRRCYVSLKMDGMSGTFANYKGLFTVSTRNRTVYSEKIKKAQRELTEKNAEKFRDNPHIYLAAKYNIPKNLPDGIAIQGEVCGQF